MAAATAVGVAGLVAAAVVVCRREPAVAEDVPAPPPPAAPEETARPRRSRAVPLMIVAAVAAVWALAVIYNDAAEEECAEARRTAYSVGSSRTFIDMSRISDACDDVLW
ncbi:hypothetical protein [Actinoplanes sp. CA-252034]|uniref:hypothetical protein n=1 Tax=Actinoplanes sp. CA-252034 TaxID=3239906 RepID=UPI003D995259